MTKSDFVAGVLVGALLGAALGIIFAPAAGEQTRERVKEGALKLKDAAAERARAVMHRREEECEKETCKED